jgi:hypothetical protein
LTATLAKTLLMDMLLPYWLTGSALSCLQRV